jgi:hypothetical protein
MVHQVAQTRCVLIHFRVGRNCDRIASTHWRRRTVVEYTIQFKQRVHVSQLNANAKIESVAGRIWKQRLGAFTQALGREIPDRVLFRRPRAVHRVANDDHSEFELLFLRSVASAAISR